MKITEKELKEKIKIFEDDDIILKFDVLIQGQIQFDRASIGYNRQTSYLTITDGVNGNELKINIASVYEINMRQHNLQMKLDDDIELIIMRK